MAQILKKSEDVARKEEREQARETKLAEERQKYFFKIKKDSLFRKFIIEEILDVLIEELTDIRNIDIDASPDEVKRTLAAAKAARLQLEKFKSRIS